MCGEYGCVGGWFLAFIGSSPRVWGIRDTRRKCFGSFPVHPHVCGEYVRHSSHLWLSCAVHPHVCGEYGFFVKVIFDTYGSSPRVWGILFWQPAALFDFRFIPTCVGNTRSPRTPIHRATVHPHVCGEYMLVSSQPFTSGRFIPTCVGNTGQRRPHTNGEDRFIPTCVGNTLSTRGGV